MDRRVLRLRNCWVYGRRLRAANNNVSSKRWVGVATVPSQVEEVLEGIVVLISFFSFTRNNGRSFRL